MWFKRGRAAFSLAALSVTLGCSSPPTAKSGVKPPQISHRLEAIDLLPADLDVVLRVDIARLKAGLGPGIAEAFAARAAEAGGEGFVSEAMAKADAVWIGLRLADLDEGDRVLVAEGKLDDVHVELSEWKETTPAATREGMQVLDRQTRAPRAGTGRIVSYNRKLFAFVSPVEVDATSRLLRDGPDSGRGDPSADGLVSIDVRGHRLPRSLEKKYPSIARVIGGVTRLRGTATLADDGLRVTIEVTNKTPEAAKRVEELLITLRDNTGPRYDDLMKSVRIERVDAHLHLSMTVPAKMLVAALSTTP